MMRLILTLTVIVLLIGLWRQQYRTIPDWTQSGVRKNFQLERGDALSGQFTVAAKRYYGAGGSVLRFSSVPAGKYNHLAYLSTVDLLLAPEQLPVQSLKDHFDIDQRRRCYALQPKNGADANSSYAVLINIAAVAADEQVAGQLRKISPGQHIYLQGYWAQAAWTDPKAKSLAGTAAHPLIAVQAADIRGKHCGVFFVERLLRLP